MTINTDDPAMMDLDLGREYERVAEAFEFDLSELGALALEGIESTWLDASDRATLAGELGPSSGVFGRRASDRAGWPSGRSARRGSSGRGRRP